MSETVYGYARVSSRDQNLSRQIIALEEFGVNQIIQDKQSGKDFDRPGWKKLLRRLKPGDVVVVKSIDRLGRNYNDIKEQWRTIIQEKKAAVVVLDMPMLDTRNKRDLMGTVIADIVLQLLSYVAQTERDFTRQRQREGIEAAKQRGQRFGRKPKQRSEGYEGVKALYQSKAISADDAAKRLGVCRNTFFKWVCEDEKRKSGGAALHGD